VSFAILLCCSETPGLPVETAAWDVAANEPLINPAIAAPATIVFFVMLTFLFFVFCYPRDGTIPLEVDQTRLSTSDYLVARAMGSQMSIAVR
jgi:hypothetical protein